MRAIIPVSRLKKVARSGRSLRNPEERQAPWAGAADGMTPRALGRMLEEAVDKVCTRRGKGYARLLSGLNRRVARGFQDKTGKLIPIETAAVRWVPYRGTHTYEIVFNPDLLAHLTEDQRAGVLEHELLHICLYHLLEMKTKNVQPKIFNLAADCTVNNNVAFDLPDWVVTLHGSFPDLFPPGTDVNSLLTWQIYERLLQKAKEVAEEQKQKGKGPPQDEEEEGEGGGGQGEGEGEEQEGEGEEQEGEEEGEGRPGKGRPGRPGKSESSPKTKKSLRDIMTGKSVFVDEHEPPPPDEKPGDKPGDKPGRPGDKKEEGKEGKPIFEKSEEEQRADEINKRLREAFKDLSSEDYGKMPGAMQKLISEMFKPKPEPAIPWRSILQQFVMQSTRTSRRMRRTVQSKRYGTFPGPRTRRHASLVLMVDTSGSVGQKVLQALFEELHHIFDVDPQLKLTVILFDSRVYDEFEFTPETEPPSISPGGTDFAAAFEYLQENHPDVTGVIVFTDGECWNLVDRNAKGEIVSERDDLRPMNAQVLWIVTRERSAGDHLIFGPSVVVEESRLLEEEG